MLFTSLLTSKIILPALFGYDNLFFWYLLRLFGECMIQDHEAAFIKKTQQSENISALSNLPPERPARF